MDAVDIACVDFAENKPRLRASASADWPDDLLRRVRAFATGEALDATAVARLDAAIGRFLGSAVNAFIEAQVPDRNAVRAIGCHGQTVAHAPGDDGPGATLQLGDANSIAEATRILTVSDFRRRDMAACGQGAPLAPAFHAATLADATEPRVVLNLGGIANLTVLPAGDGPVMGFDTGPANCLMDLWSRRHRDKAFDAEGAWAASGSTDGHLLDTMLADPYFALPAPKSTGTQYFSAAWLDHLLGRVGALPPSTVQATLLELTRASIVRAIDAHAPDARRILVCGGGVHNGFLMRRLGETLRRPVESTLAYGVDPDWMEAMAFAWLARQALDGRTGNLASVTGASGGRILGAIHPA